MRCSHLHSPTKPFLLRFHGLSEPTGEMCHVPRAVGAAGCCCQHCCSAVDPVSPVLGLCLIFHLSRALGQSGPCSGCPAQQWQGTRLFLAPCSLISSPRGHSSPARCPSWVQPWSCCQLSEFCWAVREPCSQGWWPWAVLHAHPGQQLMARASHGSPACRAGAQLLPGLAGLCVCLVPISCSNQ